MHIPKNNTPFKRLVLKNYVSHRHSVFHLHPGVNVILGDTQAGKSVITRGVRKLKDNRPPKQRFVSWFAKKGDITEISLGGVTYGIDTEPYYKIGKKKFTGFSLSVPEVISKQLNLGELNIQYQLKPHFIVTASPPEIARIINKVIRIEKVDDWVSDLNGQKIKINTKLKQCKKETKSIEQQLEALSYVDVVAKKLKLADRYLRECSELKATQKNLKQIEEKAYLLQKKLHILKPLEVVSQKLSSVEKLLARMNKIKSMVDIASVIITISKTLIRNKETFAFCAEALNKCEHTVRKTESIRKSYRSLVEAAEEILNKQDELVNVVKDWNEIKIKYLALLKTLKKCPVCLSAINNEMLKRVRVQEGL